MTRSETSLTPGSLTLAAKGSGKYQAECWVVMWAEADCLHPPPLLGLGVGEIGKGPGGEQEDIEELRKLGN